VINRAQMPGDEAGEELVTGSVVYLGRDSFRMETVVEAFDADGAPREVTGIVTSPYRTRTEIPANDAAQIANALLPQIDEDATEIIARARAGQWRADEAPSLPDALFGSQTDVPLLSAPTERILAPRRGRVALSRGTLVAAGLLLFACGLGSVAVARRATSLAATVEARQLPAAIPTEIVAVVPTEPAPTITPLMIDLPEPVLVRVHKKTAAVSSHVARHAAPEAARWVDPFAD
jgi:hypothetical protein